MAKECCTFEALVKGVMFYPGHLRLRTNKFSQVSIERDYNNAFHDKAYFVKLKADSKEECDITLGHLSRPVAEATHKLFAVPGVIISG